MAEHDPLPESALILSKEYSRVAPGDAILRHRAAAGGLARLRRGMYATTAEWQSFDASQRYRALVYAIASTRRVPAVVSHQSAAVLWSIPVLGEWPQEVHFLTERATGGRSDPGVRKHAVGLETAHAVVVNGIAVTDVARTIIDLAATSDFVTGVVAADFAIHRARFGTRQPLTTKHQLLETWESMLPFRGSARALRVIEFSSEDSGSVAESISRVNILLCGFPAPVLQKAVTVDGRTDYLDFWFEDADIGGECDGKVKYFDERMLKGRSSAEVVYDEKLREDRIRRVVTGFIRWDYATAADRYRLRHRLLSAGLQTVRPMWISSSAGLPAMRG